MANVLISGMSGTGTSSVLVELARRGHRTVDTDSDEWCEWVTVTGQNGEPERDWIWREDRIADLLATHTGGHLFVASCKTNQGQFYDRFQAVVLLTAPTEVMFQRLAARTDNPYGKSAADRAQILEYPDTGVRSRRRASAPAGARHVVGTDRPLSEVVCALELAADGTDSRNVEASGHSPIAGR